MIGVENEWHAWNSPFRATTLASGDSASMGQALMRQIINECRGHPTAQTIGDKYPISCLEVVQREGAFLDFSGVDFRRAPHTGEKASA